MDKKALLKPRLDESDVDIPGVGIVRVRALSRYEVLVAQRVMQKNGLPGYERMMLHLGMVDPALTEDEVLAWMKASRAGEIEPVTRRIAELSGMTPAAEKEAYKSFRDQSGAGVRVLPGDETVDDGGPDASGDER